MLGGFLGTSKRRAKCGGNPSPTCQAARMCVAPKLHARRSWWHAQVWRAHTKGPVRMRTTPTESECPCSMIETLSHAQASAHANWPHA